MKSHTRRLLKVLFFALIILQLIACKKEREELFEIEEVVTMTAEESEEEQQGGGEEVTPEHVEYLFNEVIFQDNFDVDGEPDHSKWVLCPKRSSDWCKYMSESYDQAYVSDGILYLVGEKVNGEYKAGGIKTEGKFAFTFGQVDVRARIPRHPDGNFPAIWMMPQTYIYSGWPNCGEIDIMEHIKQQAFIHQTIHSHYTYDLKYTSPTNTTTTTCNYDSDENWVVYSVRWSPEEITFYVNYNKTFSYPNLHLDDEDNMKQWPFTKDASFYLILNMGLGGSWAGSINDAGLPAVMEIDKVVVYKMTEIRG